RREAGEIDAEPFRQRRVDIGDPVGGIGGEEAGRRMVEMVDRLLEIEEEALLFGALAGDVGDFPCRERLPVAGNLEGARAQAVPARAGFRTRADRVVKAELALVGNA